MDQKQLSKLANYLIAAFAKEDVQPQDKKISVNPVVAKFATWYEKLRTAMDYREEEVILRAAIERILKRRLLLGGRGKTVAAPLIRELVWARYFPNDSLSESFIGKIEERVDLHLLLREQILLTHKMQEGILNEWTYHLMSSDIEKILKPNREKELVANFMFQIMREHVTISDDSEQTKDAQVYIAVRRSFAKDDLAFLRYHLFMQIFGDLTKERIERIAASFPKGYSEIQKQLSYPRKDRIYTYIKSKTAVFFILEDVLRKHKGATKELIQTQEELKKAVNATCNERYKGINAKVRRAIIRSVLFILLTKVFFAFTVEGTYERIFFGQIFWTSMLLNTSVPALLMIIVGIFIQTPKDENTQRIFSFLQAILHQEKPELGSRLFVKLRPERGRPFLLFIFTLLWALAFIVTFGAIIFVLSKLGMHIVSQAIFIFFLAIVSFLSYRIALIPRTYMVEEKQGLLTPVVDFFFMPVIRVGRHLTEGISQINALLFLFDLLIETPFKGLFAFFEQWFLFLHAKREDLG